MAYHVPFNQRNRRPPVVYIGFDAKRRRKFNWWGFNGLWMSMAAFFTAGLFSPIALLVSMRGLKRKPRKMAVAGTMLSLAGTALFVGLLVHGISEKANRDYLSRLRLQNAAIQKQVDKTDELIESAVAELVDFRENNDGKLPSWVDGNMLLLKHVDPWGNSLRFDAEKGYALVRSAGPDGEFDNSDDVTTKVIGQTNRRILLEL